MNKNNYNHPFHLVTLSPWPLLNSISLMIMMIGLINWFHKMYNKLFILGMLLMMLISILWWRDIIRESTFQGFHTFKVIKLMRMGMMMFIISELFFFISFFWTFFHMSLSPSIEIGEMWPPKLIMPFNPYNIPLLNTIILITSGFSITWSHYNILNNKFKETIYSLIFTIILGLYFTMLQIFEYFESMFTISDSVYGSTFFLTTGFHGIHVIIGTLFILMSFTRLMMNQFSYKHHFLFEASSWYWHFVDVIWLFLFTFIYWWTF